MPAPKRSATKNDKETIPRIIPDVDRDYIKKIATRVKELRVKSGYSSYEAFALHAGINRNSYFRFEKKSAETGENFTIALLLKIVRGLDISLADFFKDIN